MRSITREPPFSTDDLDRLLDEAGIDLLLVTSKHNIRYLLGGYHHHFFAYMDAIGVSRYLPVLAYLRGLPEQAIYVANRNEKDSIEVRRREDREIWVPTVRAASSGTRDAVALAIQHVQSLDRPPRTIGIEAAFLPWDAGSMVVDAFQGAAVVDALRPLERLRAVKTDAELALLRRASELVVDAMLASISAVAPGTSKREVLATLRREETARNLDFDYGLITFGSGLNRAPSDETLSKGDILSIDSGGNLEGYIGDLCRMAILGHPDSELQDLLAEVRSIQDVARRVVRSGVRGGDVVEAGQRAVSHSALAKSLSFVVHGMGLVSHEAPRLSDRGPIPYSAPDADLPLQSGMVLSVETTLTHPTRGFIKLEDTIAVTEAGSEGFGDVARDWNSIER